MRARQQWKVVSQCNKPILEYVESIDGNGLTLIDFGCGMGVLSDLARKVGFNVTSIDLGDTPYEYNQKIDARTVTEYYDYIIGSGFPPQYLPNKLNCKYFIFSSVRQDFKSKYPGELFNYSKSIFVRTNIKNFIDNSKSNIL